MLAQYTAASLVSESKTLAHPASVDSIPSSAGQEDHVSMGMTSARHAREIVTNAEIVVALEAARGGAGARPPRAASSRGRDARGPRGRPRRVAFLENDRELAPDIDAAVELVRGDDLLDAVEAAVGSLI